MQVPNRNLLGSFGLKIDKAQRHQYWTFDVGSSMFYVQYVYCSGQAVIHMSCHF